MDKMATDPTTSAMTKLLADENRSRDVRRRVEVIHKKLADLQDLGIPCAFCYSSTRTGSVFTLGDTRITDIIERHKNEIHVNLQEDCSKQPRDSFSKEIHLILPPLPSPLEEIERHTLQSLIIGILKDLGLKWTDPKPNWWPLDVPFIHPRSVPPNINGNWVYAMRKVLESVYSYFSYDVNNYISSQLEPIQADQHESRSSTSSVSDTRRLQLQTQLSDNERDTAAKSMPEDFTKHSGNVAEKKPPNKLISNFTVENILMGPQHSSSGSSHSPSSTGSSLTSPTDYSSVMGGSWVSHPPVKYTKYTMLSPVSMGDDNRLKRKSKPEPSPISRPSGSPPRRYSSSNDISIGVGTPTEKHSLGIKRVPSNPIPPRNSNRQQFSSAATLRACLPTPTSLTGASISKLVSTEAPQSNLQSRNQTVLAKSVSTLPVIQAVPFSSTDQKTILQQNFPPSQQFVLLVPSTSTSVTEGLQAVVYANQTPLSSSSPTMTSLPSKSRFSKEQHVSESELSYSSPSHNSNSDSDKLPLEVNYRPIAPKSKPLFREVPSSTAATDTPGDKRLYKRSLTKPQKLRFHMTTVVKRPKRSVMTSSMTVESPSSIINERTRTTSFVLDSQPAVDILAEASITKSKNHYSNEKQLQTEQADKNEESEGSITPTDIPCLNENQDHLNSSQSSAIVLKDSQFHVKRIDPEKSDLAIVHSHDDKHFGVGSPGDNGRTTRSYTRRKRELTFHLYEDPDTAFKAKRNCKE